MSVRRLVLAGLAASAVSACVSPHQENAALRAPWPKSSSSALVAYIPPEDAYPSVGGDILKGASPAEWAAARAAASRPLTEPDEPASKP